MLNGTRPLMEGMRAKGQVDTLALHRKKKRGTYAIVKGEERRIVNMQVVLQIC